LPKTIVVAPEMFDIGKVRSTISLQNFVLEVEWEVNPEFKTCSFKFSRYKRRPKCIAASVKACCDRLACYRHAVLRAVYNASCAEFICLMAPRRLLPAPSPTLRFMYSGLRSQHRCPLSAISTYLRMRLATMSLSAVGRPQ